MQHKLIAKNTFYQILARVITSIIGFLITIIIARDFGVLGYGDFIKITSYVALFYLIVDFGLNAFFLQYEKVKFKNLFYLRLLISSVLFILLNLIAFFIPYNQQLNSGFSDTVKLGIFVFSFTVFFQGIIFCASAVFQKSLNYLGYAVAVIIGAVINLMVVLLFAFLNYSIFYILSSFIFSSLITAALLLKFTKENLLPFSLEKTFVKDILIKSLPIGLMLIFNLVYFRADMLLLSVFSSTKDVGIYGLSYKFFDFLIALPLFLSNAIYPFLIREKNNKAKFFNTTKKYFFVFLLLSLIVIVPFWFISPFFTLIKTDFSPSMIPFRILLISLPFFFTTSFLQWALITLEKQKYLMYVYLIAAVINIVLNIIYIPKYSYFASAAITIISEGFVFIFLLTKIISTKKLLEREAKNNG